MKLRDSMSAPAIRVGAGEPVTVAARTLAQYDLGALPVCSADGKPVGLLTDRDIVTRCLAAGRDPGRTLVREIMSRNAVTAEGDMDTSAAAALMGRLQIRRLPVVEQGRLQGMVTLGDLAGNPETEMDAADALSRISEGVRGGEGKY